jgi:hypothetical protein
MQKARLRTLVAISLDPNDVVIVSRVLWWQLNGDHLHFMTDDRESQVMQLHRKYIGVYERG